MVNNQFAADAKKTSHYGENFNTIDFDVHPTSKAVVSRLQQNTTMGELSFAGRKTKCTIGEVEFLIETLQNAKQVFMQKYRFGM